MSCENPQTEPDALMQRESWKRNSTLRCFNVFVGRKKYDKTRNCVRCKDATGNIVIRHAVYCKFVELPGRLLLLC